MEFSSSLLIFLHSLEYFPFLWVGDKNSQDSNIQQIYRRVWHCFLNNND